MWDIATSRRTTGEDVLVDTKLMSQTTQSAQRRSGGTVAFRVGKREGNHAVLTSGWKLPFGSLQGLVIR